MKNSISDIDTGAADSYFLWGDGNVSASQQRYLFISENCDTSIKSQLNLSKEYLPCLLMGQAKNGAVTINRVGFASDDLKDPGTTIARMDVIVAFSLSKGNERFHFADYAEPFSKALSYSGLIASHMMVVHRSNTGNDWQLITKKDGKTPIELNDIAVNMDALTKYPATEYFGVRFTFDMNDNDSGSNGGGGNANVCWDSANSTVVHCFEQYAGEDEHGDDSVLALTTKPSKDEKDPSKIKPGTLNANLIMENTSRRVYIFKRKMGGSLIMDGSGKPEPYEWSDPKGTPFVGEYYQDDNRQGDSMGTSSLDNARNYYPSSTYDAFELVTPAIVDYIGSRADKSDSDGDDYAEYNDYALDNHRGALRYPIQVCPKITQKIMLRDAFGVEKPSDYVEFERQLFPRLSVSVSSFSAYKGVASSGSGTGGSSLQLEQLNANRTTINSSEHVGTVGGITTQAEIVEQNMNEMNESQNSAEHLIYENHKYIWAITNTLGMYDADTGKGVNVENSADVSYTVTRWCSTIPQTGTPADLIATYEYE